MPANHSPDIAKQFQALVARYLDEHEPLDVVATEFAQLWVRWSESGSSQPIPRFAPKEARGASFLVNGVGELRPGLTGEDAPRLEELITAAVAKLPMLRDGAV